MSRFKLNTFHVLTSFVLCLFFTASSYAGFTVSGKQLLDANGNNFIMRGVNHPHTWYRGETSSFTNIAATGANTIRVVLSTGGRWTRNDGGDVANVIAMCKQNKLVCVLEVHDSTGFTEQSGSTPISDAVNYWLSSDIMPLLQGEEDYVIINIANEPYGNNASRSQYVDGTKGAIQALRTAGLTHTLMIDAANWGQDWQFFMRDSAPEIFAADVLANTVFDVHMYEVFRNSTQQEAYIQAFQTHNLPLIIGEFGPVHNNQNIDVSSLLAFAKQYGIGYMGWSWSGNGGCCTALDIVNNFNPNSLTSWGTQLIDGVNGIRETSILASVYGDGTGNANIAPIPAFTSVATDLAVSFNANASSDPDAGPQALSYVWDFGDGQSSNLKNPSHTYSAANSYQVSLTLSDGQDTRALTKTVTVRNTSGDVNTAPIAAFTSTTNDLVVSFNANASSDPDNGPQALTYNWNFGDGQSSTEKNPTHTYASANSYVVTLTVSDGQDANVASKTVTVSSSTPGNSSCEYVVQNEWNNGFVGEIRITNNGASAISGWQVSWSYSDGTTLSSTWNSSLSGSGTSGAPYTANNLSYNSNIASGQSVSFGFQGSHNGSTSVPVVNGSVCN